MGNIKKGDLIGIGRNSGQFIANGGVQTKTVKNVKRFGLSTARFSGPVIPLYYKSLLVLEVGSTGQGVVFYKVLWGEKIVWVWERNVCKTSLLSSK